MKMESIKTISNKKKYTPEEIQLLKGKLLVKKKMNLQKIQ